MYDINTTPFIGERCTASPESIERAVRVRRSVVAFPSPPVGSAEARAPRIMDAILALSGNCEVSVSFSKDDGDSPLRACVALETADDLDAALAGRRLDQFLAFALAGTRFEDASDYGPAALQWRRIVPAATTLLRVSRAATKPSLIAAEGVADDMPLVCNLAARAFDLPAALSILSAAAPAELRVGIRPFVIEGRVHRALKRLKDRSMAMDATGAEMSDGQLPGFLADLARQGRGIELSASLGSPDGLDPYLIDLICLALFGAHAETGSRESDDLVDLRGVWPAGWPLPSLLPSAATILAFDSSPPARPGPAGSGDVEIGLAPGGLPVRLTAADRARHLYIIGATGTGKSTLMLNMLAQDFASGEGVILLDPHGDLADDVLALIPARRRAETIFADAGNPDGAYALNILGAHGDDPETDRAAAANSLIRLLSRTLHAGVPEAFGPMFEAYFMNAMLLLMEAGGESANLADFEAIFLDRTAREAMLQQCADPKVLQFWQKMVPGVTHDEITLNNIAPYITSKMAQFTGNPLMRRILCRPEGAIDLGQAMDDGQIVIFKAPKGRLGQAGSELLAAVTVMQLARAAMARASRPRTDRRPVRVYIDEFQTCASEGLSDLLAESRKFGVSLVLANQSISQVDGAGRRPDTGAAALANAASLIAFRVGAPDAARLGPWLAPDVEWSDLCRLPDFQAVARVLDHGRPAAARRLRMSPPPLVDAISRLGPVGRWRPRA